MHSSDSLPPIHLIPFDSAPTLERLPIPPSDLRALHVEEFLKARSLSANSLRQIAQFKCH